MNGSCRKKDAGDEMREDTIEICHLKKAYGEHVIFSNLTMELKKGADIEALENLLYKKT